MHGRYLTFLDTFVLFGYAFASLETAQITFIALGEMKLDISPDTLTSLDDTFGKLDLVLMIAVLLLGFVYVWFWVTPLELRKTLDQPRGKVTKDSFYSIGDIPGMVGGEGPSGGDGDRPLLGKGRKIEERKLARNPVGEQGGAHIELVRPCESDLASEPQDHVLSEI